MITQALTEAQIIENHAPGVRSRARMELQIVNALIARAGELSLTVDIWEARGEDEYDVRSTLFDLDVANITFCDAEGVRVGWVRLVFGNGGWDLMSDYSATESCGEFIAPILELADAMYKYGGPLQTERQGV